MTDTDFLIPEERDSHGKQKRRNTEVHGDTDCGQINTEPETLPIHNLKYTNIYNVHALITFCFPGENWPDDVGQLEDYSRHINIIGLFL